MNLRILLALCPSEKKETAIGLTSNQPVAYFVACYYAVYGHPLIA